MAETEIVEDVKEECEKYGQVLEIKIPRPSMGSRQSAGVGKIYVKFGNAEIARKALQNLAGRKFADRTVVTTYFSEVSSPYVSVLGGGLWSCRKALKSMLGKGRLLRKDIAFAGVIETADISAVLTVLARGPRFNPAKSGGKATTTLNSSVLAPFEWSFSRAQDMFRGSGEFCS